MATGIHEYYNMNIKEIKAYEEFVAFILDAIGEDMSNNNDKSLFSQLFNNKDNDRRAFYDPRISLAIANSKNLLFLKILVLNKCPIYSASFEAIKNISIKTNLQKCPHFLICQDFNDFIFYSLNKKEFG
jgi:hypothetical protein